ncbi:MAG: DinB family protein [Burkholderiales bacterium]
MQLADYFQGLAHYHAWATRQLLDRHLALLLDTEWRAERRLFFGSIHRTLNHLLVAENIWWGRVAENHSRPIALDTELHEGRDELCKALLLATQRWSGWLSTIDSARWDGDLAYTRNNGEAVRIPFAPTLGHVFNHGTHHRGQITAALTAMGKPAPELDWVYLLQQEARSK